jgi:hypothetical protein
MSKNSKQTNITFTEVVGKTTEEKVLIAEENLFLAARSELERKRKAKHELAQS